MTSPAEQYASSRRRAAEARSGLGEFRDLYDFELDEFQLEACRALEAGAGVLVAAPTGAGKTVVGEFAVHLALREGRKCFYTAPIKALSNQKYHDLVDRYGAARVGLLTGDNSVNGEAPVVVMTTEVLRNMIYAGSQTLDGLAYVVMDEVHYLADRFRGAVWEEVIIHLPEHVAVVALSATVSNAEEFGEWLTEVRGETRIVVEEHRPVPLWQHVMAGQRLYDLFVDDAQSRVNPELVRLAREDERVARLTRESRRDGDYRAGGGPRPARGGRRPRSINVPLRYEVVERLNRDRLLPAITFVFSRVGCDAAVEQCLAAGLRLTSNEERARIREIVEGQCRDLPQEDLLVLGYASWLDGLERGFAAHHAGMLPTFKETVEALFQQGLVKMVFATETLALGINMPARTVVLEKLVKWNGETHADVTPGEYTQLTGRAGRRGIDIEGNAVVVWHQGFDPGALAGLASTRTYPLRSSFKPSYNMAVNLVGSVGHHAARELLETSFAQFQADRAVVGLARQVRKQEEAIEGYRQAMTCHLGDFEEYAELRRRLTDREKELARDGAVRRRAAVATSLAALKPGDVIVIPSGRRSGVAVVLDPGLHERDEPRPSVLTIDRQVKRLSVVDFPAPAERLESIRIPKLFNPRSANARRDLAARLKEAAGDIHVDRPRKQRSGTGEDAVVLELRRLIRLHPCHGCDEREQHARWAERYHRLQRETHGLERRVESRTNSIARQFDRVCAILARLGYLTGEDDTATVTDAGRMLQRLYNEMDLVAAECLRQGLWVGLTAPELAACASALVFESRQADDAVPPKLPTGRVGDVLTETVRLWSELAALEAEEKVSFLREPDLGFAYAAYRWASGHRLESVLRDADLAAGDFVRWCKQLADILGQIGDAAGAETTPEGAGLARAAHEAVGAVKRGVVAFSSV